MEIKVIILFISIFFIQLNLVLSASIPCKQKDFGHGRIVCLCTEEYCDNFEFSWENISKGNYYQVTSSKNGLRFQSSEGQIAPLNSTSNINSRPKFLFQYFNTSVVIIHIDRNLRYQKILGFGGAFTDSAGINLLKLKPQFQKTLIENYYGKNGIQYSMGRVPIGGSDFSTRPYSYDDFENDKTLANFSLTDEDTNFKIPFIKYALTLNPNIKLFASPWSAPKWMKSNNEFNGAGTLLPEYNQLWADYFIKFLDEYSKNGIEFWGLTTQNEPLAGFIPFYKWNCMGFTATMMKNFIVKYLGPTITSSQFNKTKLIILDDQRQSITHWTRTILGDPESAKYISGIGIHWYWNWLIGPEALNIANREFPHFFQLATEACNGYLFFEPDVILGSWYRGESYAHDIIENLNNWVTGWVDWNLFLDMKGGPNWAKNEVDAPIIIDYSNNTAYKNPMYYALGHFSKFIIEDSERISVTSDDFKGLEVTSVLRPDGKVVVVVLNRNDEKIPIEIEDSKSGSIIMDIESRSINTFIYE